MMQRKLLFTAPVAPSKPVAVPAAPAPLSSPAHRAPRYEGADTPEDLTDWPQDKPLPYPHTSIFCGTPEPWDPLNHFIEIVAGPYKTFSQASAQLTCHGWTHLWNQERRHVWLKRDFRNPELLHGAQPYETPEGWVIMYRKIMGRPYYAHKPGDLVELSRAVQ